MIKLFDYVKSHHYRQVQQPDHGGTFALSWLVDVGARDKTHEFALRNAFGDVYLSLIKWADLYHQWNAEAASNAEIPQMTTPLERRADGQH